MESIEGVFGVGLEVKGNSDVVVIAGGTGVLPFLDLFDLVMKKAIALVAEKAGVNSDNYDPYKIGYKSLFPNSRFTLFVSFMHEEEFANYGWLKDLHKISVDNNLGLFELWVRLPNMETSTEHFCFTNLIDETFF